MSTTEIDNALRKAAGNKIPDGVQDTDKLQVLGLDSLDIVELLTSIEDELGMDVPVDVADLGPQPTWGRLKAAVASSFA